MILLLQTLFCFALGTKTDEAIQQIKTLVESAPFKAESYKKLAELSDTIGPRMWGSQQLLDAEDWLLNVIQKDFPDAKKEALKPFKTWRRGEEYLTLYEPRQVPQKLKVIGLGLSEPGTVKAEVIVVRDWNELNAVSTQVKDKIVLMSFDFGVYSTMRDYRTQGPSVVAALGAKAYLLKSIASDSMQTPHTGYTSYNGTRIPAAAISTEDAEMFWRMQQRKQKIVVELSLQSEIFTGEGHNIIAEIKGSQYPEQILVMGGHLDSWDTGAQTGANDDGGGVLICYEALRVLKALNIPIKRTIRFIAWSGEEMAQADKGAVQYADAHAAENHILALENDQGSLKAVGFGFTGTLAAKRQIKTLINLYLPEFSKVWSDDGTMSDTLPLGKKGVPMIANIVNDTPTGDFYFKYHHSAADSISMMNPDDMDSNIVAIASIMYLVADAEQTLPK
ncbi:hypothetical protein pb186bvf_008726 [Paramecium bursaria]